MLALLRFNLAALIVLLSAKGISETVGVQQGRDGRNVLEDSFLTNTIPEFDPTPPRNVSALVGKTAFLTCVVRNLKPTQRVSWVRHRDVHILTAGEQTFTSDQRFSAKHNSDDEWVLVIKYIQERDAGIYECQIPTQPPQSYPINLNIIVPHVRIQGSPDLHVDRGSTINLTCVISHSPEPPAYIFWYHNDEVVSYESPRGGITVVTENGRETQSHLIIRNARPSDSGNYTCKPSIFKTAAVRLHVLTGELPAAMHTSSAPAFKWQPTLVTLSTTITTFFSSYFFSNTFNKFTVEGFPV